MQDHYGAPRFLVSRRFNHGNSQLRIRRPDVDSQLLVHSQQLPGRRCQRGGRVQRIHPVGRGDHNRTQQFRAPAQTDDDPAKAILRLVDTGKYDLIVMGRRGIGGLKGLLMGSLSHKVSNMADCTVVTVK